MFHIRHPIVLWQTFVIHCKASTNVCLAFFCKVIWGAASHWKLHQLLAFLSDLCLRRRHPHGHQPLKAAVGRAVVTLLLSMLLQHSPSHQPKNAGPKRVSWKEWRGESLKHSLRKPVSLLHSSHISSHGLGHQEFPSRRNPGKKCCF